MEKESKTTSFNHLLDKHIGKQGTTKREAFENDVRADSLGLAIKQVRLMLGFTQEQLGKMVGVQKAQISKIENSAKDARIGTLLKVFSALGVKVTFNVASINENEKNFTRESKSNPQQDEDNYKSNKREPDETANLLSTAANRKRLKQSIKQFK